MATAKKTPGKKAKKKAPTSPRQQNASAAVTDVSAPGPVHSLAQLFRDFALQTRAMIVWQAGAEGINDLSEKQWADVKAKWGKKVLAAAWYVRGIHVYLSTAYPRPIEEAVKLTRLTSDLMHVWLPAFRPGSIDQQWFERLMKIMEDCEYWAAVLATISAAADVAEDGFTPTDADVEILKALEQRQTLCKADSLSVRNVGEHKIKSRLPELEKHGLVDRPEGLRSGWAITPKGRDLLRTLSGSNTHAART